MAAQLSSTEPFEIPVFPLNTVLFPGGLLELKIFEARYVDMISRCLRNGTGFVVAPIRSGKEVGGGAEIYTIATLVEIVNWDQLNNGLLGITVQGKQKVAILSSEEQSDLLLKAIVKPFPEQASTPLPLEFTSLAELLEKILRDIGKPFDLLQPQLDDAAWVVDRLIELLPLALEDKQKMLEIPDPLSRLLWLEDVMRGMEII